jgi:hypothetical protein
MSANSSVTQPPTTQTGGAGQPPTNTSTPRMGVDPEQVKAPKPAPTGWYELKLTGFKPKLDKSKQGVNYNAQLEIVNNTTENNGKKVYMGLSTKFARAHADFTHGFGFPLNPNGSIPGDWVPDSADPNNVEKFQYKGPLIGKVMKAELGITTYQGNERNEVNQIMCKVDGCATKFPEIRHMTKMISNK